jgi:hypothetical protein
MVVLLDKPAGKERMEGIVKTELYPGKYQSPMVLTDEQPPSPVSLFYGTCRISVGGIWNPASGSDDVQLIPDPILKPGHVSNDKFYVYIAGLQQDF